MEEGSSSELAFPQGCVPRGNLALTPPVCVSLSVLCCCLPQDLLILGSFSGPFPAFQLFIFSFPSTLNFVLALMLATLPPLFTLYFYPLSPIQLHSQQPIHFRQPKVMSLSPQHFQTPLNPSGPGLGKQLTR